MNDDLSELTAEIERRWDQPPTEELRALCRTAADRAAAAGDAATRVDLLRRLAAVASNLGDDDAAVLAVLDEAREAATTAGLHGLVGMVNLDMALVVGADDPPTLTAHLRAAADAFGEDGDLVRQATTLIDVGECTGTAGHREEALEIFGRARALAREAGDGVLTARADDRLAAGCWELGRLEDAEAHLRNALAVAEAAGEPLALAHARFRLGWCLAGSGRGPLIADEALHLLGEARAVAQQAGDLRRVAECDEKAAWVRGDCGDQDGAIKLLRSAIAVFDSIGDDEAMLITKVNLAEHLGDAEEEDEALDILRSVVTTSAERGLHYIHAGAVARLATELALDGEGAEALELLDGVGSYFDEDDDRLEGTRFLLARAAAYNALERVEATREAAQKALDRLDRASLPELQARALEYLADCALSDGDEVKAESLFGQAMALYLIDGETEDALRIAIRIMPAPPERTTTNPPRPLSIGMYL